MSRRYPCFEAGVEIKPSRCWRMRVIRSPSRNVTELLYISSNTLEELETVFNYYTETEFIVNFNKTVF